VVSAGGPVDSGEHTPLRGRPAIGPECSQVKARIQKIGFICTGSLVERWTTCGKPNCRCSTDPERRHGPYYQLTWKEKGVTVTRRLSPEHAKLYQKWVANRQRLESLLAQMHRVSVEAARHFLRAATHASSTPEEPPLRRRSRKSP
jgi:hypothetical protein